MYGVEIEIEGQSVHRDNIMGDSMVLHMAARPRTSTAAG